MYRLRLWRMKRFLLKSNGDVTILKEWKHCRIKCVKEKGQMQVTVHLHKTGDTFWTYTTYTVSEAGEMTKVRSGKYPASFVR